MDHMDDAPSRPGRPRGADGAQLLDAARHVFLQHGYGGATMADVAAEAHVSKNSLYRDYPSKGALFAAVVTDWVSRGRDAMRPHVDALAGSDDVVAGLRQFATVLQRAVLSDEVLGMRRIVAAEAERFPNVARDYVADSWDRNIEILSRAFDELMARGLMRLADATAAARLLTWMVVGEPLNARTLGVKPGPAESQHLQSILDAAVSAFVARYVSEP
jgi:TetR/AcrR family transcriptional repressor of mexJK operon